MAKTEVNKTIEVLSDEEHVLLRNEWYIGPPDAIEDKIPIVENGLLIRKLKSYSIGMYRLFEEVLDNAIDEAKRCYHLGVPMKEIQVKVISKENAIKVVDFGQGFKNSLEINKKSGVSTIETAMTFLRAGSNFKNQDSEISYIGMNGVGVSCVNILSDKFWIKTGDGKDYYFQQWEKFVETDKMVEKYDEPHRFHVGTTIYFVPRKEIYKKQKWDLEILRTKMNFTKFLIKQDFTLKDLNIAFFWDDDEINIDEAFIPEEHLAWKTGNTSIFLWKTVKEDMTSISFVNGSQCSGIHQKIVTDFINDSLFESSQAYKFYETCIISNLPPKYVKFDAQIKNKLVTPKEEILRILKYYPTKTELKNFQKNEIYVSILEDILALMKKDEIKEFKRAKKQAKIRVASDKFYGSEKKENLYLTEGLSALGAILQKRNPKTDAFYALRGKVKNVRCLSDLTSNIEIVDLINILNLNLEDQGEKCAYKKVIISADADEDGIGHVVSLLINFFALWFPKMITMDKLYILQTPLISIEKGKERKYLYSLNEIDGTQGAIRYLKGLGSLDIKDWEHVFKNMQLLKIKLDVNAMKNLKMAFGNDAILRKNWLRK